MAEGGRPDQAPMTVTIGLLDKSKRFGRLYEFDPGAETMTLTVPPRTFDGPILDELIVVDLDDVAYVAFHASATGAPKATEERKELVEYDVHLTTGEHFSVAAAPGDILDPVGFFARPLGSSSAFERIWFSAKALAIREDRSPFGVMLMRDDLVTLEELDRALEEQTASRAAPLGQILVEQERVSPRDRDEAVEKQRELLRRGRPLKLGEILIEAGLATEADIEAALAEQKKRRGRRLGEVLVDLGIVSEHDVAKTLARSSVSPSSISTPSPSTRRRSASCRWGCSSGMGCFLTRPTSGRSPWR